jgi:hypothetical protein
MKRINTILLAVMLSASIFAQVPQKITYQAVVRDDNGTLISNTQVGIEINIYQDSVTGTLVYTETQTPTTNANGLLTIEIGGQTGFDTISWANGPYFLETNIDPAGGTNYTITGASQLLTVPYALYAKTADSLAGGIVETDPVFSSSVASGITATDTANWNVWEKNNNDIYFNSGKIGIGTTSPAEMIHISKDDYSYVMSQTLGDYDAGVKFKANSVGNETNGINGYAILIKGTDNSGDLLINEDYINGTFNPTTRLTIKNESGFIGIGTNTPEALLHIKGDMHDILTVQDNNGGAGNIVRIVFNTCGDDNVGMAGIGSCDADNYNGDLVFYTDEDNTANKNLTEKMRLTYDGKLGIGTTSPARKLQISGDAVIRLEPLSTEPSNPQVGDIYMDDGTNTSNSKPKLKVYDGTSWQECW